MLYDSLTPEDYKSLKALSSKQDSDFRNLRDESNTLCDPRHFSVFDDSGECMYRTAYSSTLRPYRILKGYLYGIAMALLLEAVLFAWFPGGGSGAIRYLYGNMGFYVWPAKCMLCGSFFSGFAGAKNHDDFESYGFGCWGYIFLHGLLMVSPPVILKIVLILGLFYTLIVIPVWILIDRAIVSSTRKKKARDNQSEE